MFDDSSVKTFECLNEQLILDPIIVSLDWSLPFEVSCNASCVDLGVVLGQKYEKIPYPSTILTKHLNPI